MAFLATCASEPFVEELSCRAIQASHAGLIGQFACGRRLSVLSLD